MSRSALIIPLMLIFNLEAAASEFEEIKKDYLSFSEQKKSDTIRWLGECYEDVASAICIKASKRWLSMHDSGAEKYFDKSPVERVISGVEGRNAMAKMMLSVDGVDKYMDVKEALSRDILLVRKVIRESSM